jgi:hypothetical protein
MLLGRAWSAVAGPLTLLFIAAGLSKEEQGYYYTFFSVTALTLFFELGLSSVILQFASHEKARLQWTPAGKLEGDQEAKSRLGSLLRAAVLWYGVAATLVVLAIGPGGYLFFHNHGLERTPVPWEGPWAAVVLVTALSLGLTPFYGVLEGTGLLPQIARIRVCQNILGNLLAWAALVGGLGLFAACCVNLAGVSCGLIWLGCTKRAVLVDLWRSHADGGRLHWWTEVWPMQWRIALSWMGSYFIFQLFTPVLFAYRSEQEAGQWGMSFALVGTATSLAGFWLYARAPLFGTLIARRAFGELDRLFFRTLWQSLGVATAGMVVIFLCVLALAYQGNPWKERLLTPLPLALLAVTALISHTVMAQAIYLRAHKRDPFFGIYLAVGALVGLNTYFLGRVHGSTGMAVGYFAMYLVVGLGVGTWVFLTKREEWHARDRYRVGEA